MKTTLIALLVVVALVLAFLVGKNMHGDEHMGEHRPPPVDPGAEQAVEQAFTDGAKDGQWKEEEDFVFMRAIARLDKAGQLKHLLALADAVNSGKLHIESLKGTAPCCPTCTQCGQQQTPPPAGVNTPPAQTPKAEGARAK